MMKLIFYGTRGSTPVCGKEYMEYGGNTTCIGLEAEDKLFILDCGTGLMSLQKMQFDTEHYRSAHIFITHLHWDHIQGIAFFGPFFAPGCEFEIYGERRYDKSIREQIESVMESPMFPVQADSFQAKMDYRDVSCGDRIQIGGVAIETIRLDHPNVCTGYRITYGGKSVCLAGDCENANEEIEAFAMGADVLICDAQYTDAEYPAKKGWGHSTWQRCCQLGEKCRAGKLILTHHDPSRTDMELEALKKELRKNGYGENAVFAFDGMELLV